MNVAKGFFDESEVIEIECLMIFEVNPNHFSS